YSYFVRQAHADLEWWGTEIGEQYPSAAFARIFNDWQEHATWNERGLVFSPDYIRQHSSFQFMRDWIIQRIFPDLPDNCSLGSYNVGNIRTFFACLQTVCDCMRGLEELTDRRLGEN